MGLMRCLHLGAVKEVMMLQWQKISVAVAFKICMYVVVVMMMRVICNSHFTATIVMLK
jgi:hypothetical protein